MAEPNPFDQFDGPPSARITVGPPDKSPENPFDQFDDAVLPDVAKSAGIGTVKGGIGMLGAFGDLRDVLHKGVDTVAKKFDLAPEHTDTIKKGLTASMMALPGLGWNVAMAPGSANIRKFVEDEATGPLYEPKTGAGHVAQTVGEFVPGAIAGPGGAIRKGITNVLMPALGAEGAGAATKGTAAERYARAGGAVAAGLLGHTVAPGVGAAERAIGSQLPEWVTDAHVGQAEGLIQDAAARGVQLTWPEAMSQVAGQPVMSSMGRVIESAPHTRPQMEEFYGQRPQQMQTAAEGEIANIAPQNPQPSTIGPAVGAAAEGTANDLRGAINNVTDPLYAQAANVRLTAREMAQVRRLPGYDEARDAIRNDPQLDRYVRGLPEDSVGFLNEVKKYLDTAAENATSPVTQRGRNMQRAAGYENDAAAARRIGVNASPEYEQALQTQADLRTHYLDPLLQGPIGKLADRDISTRKAIDALFPKEPLAGSEREITRAVSDLAARNPWAARQLVRAHVEQKLDEAFNAAGRGQEAAQFAGATFAHRLSGSPVVTTQRMENLRAAVEALPNGQDIWQGLGRFLEIAQATGTRQPKGSLTSFNTRELERMSTGGAVETAVKHGFSPGEWMHLAHDAVGRWQVGRNLDQLARIITDPRSGDLLRRIARMPGRSREGQLLAARIVAGFGSGTTDEKKK